MPKTRTRRPKTKRQRNCNTNKLNITSWYKKCKICSADVVGPNSIAMWLHFNRNHPELNRSLVPLVPIRDSHASTTSENVGRNTQRRKVPRNPRKNLRQPKRKL